MVKMEGELGLDHRVAIQLVVAYMYSPVRWMRPSDWEGSIL